MSDWLERFGGLLVDASLSATILLGLTALAMIGCRQPVRRIFLARAAILSTLVLIPLAALAPVPPIPIDRLLRQSGILAHPFFSDHDPSQDRLTVQSAGSEGRQTMVGGSLHRRLIGPPPRWLVVLYLAGSATVLSGLLLGHWGLSWLMARSCDVSLQATELYTTLGTTGHRPRLRVSTRISRPVLVGLFRPTILIPIELDLPESREKLRLSLLHELAHTERGDAWFGLFSSLAQVFWYFLPPLWWIRSQMRLDQEFLADRRAARNFGPFQSYAAGLLKIASGPLEAGSPAAPQRSTRTTGASALFQRMLMLVQCPFPIETHPPHWWSGLWVGLVVLGTLTASALTLRVSDPAGPGHGRTTATVMPKQSFRMARFNVDANRHPSDRPQVYHLPVPLPSYFDLKLEVWGNSESLAQTRVVGVRLRKPHPDSEPNNAPLAWHQVRITRSRDGLEVWLDQTPLLPPPEEPLTATLSFELATHLSAQFRNVLLAW